MSNYALWMLFGPSSWLLWALLIAAIALLAGGRRGPRIARTAVLGGLVAGLSLMLLPSGFFLIEPLETRFPIVRRDAVVATDIIVLAGGERLGPAFRHGRPEHGEHNERVYGAAMLAKRLPGARLWAVGGVRLWPDSPRDVDWMFAAWRDLGIAPERIVMVSDTTDTCENAKGVRRRLGAGRRTVLVTSAFHMPRAMACFRAAGIDPLPYPVDFQNGPRRGIANVMSTNLDDNFMRSSLALHEYVGLLYYRAGGRIANIWPEPSRRVLNGYPVNETETR